MVKIVRYRCGNINEKFVEKVFAIITNCYECIRAHSVEIVDLFLFDTASLMNAFLMEEKKKLGVKTSTFESSFFAVHDAWHGIPRIMVASDKMLDVPKLVVKGCLEHEVAHTILHGSLKYYVFPIPAVLLELEKEEIVSRSVALDLLYLVTIAVKDYEVTRFLSKHGFVEEQVAYCRFFLEPSHEDYEVWELAKENRVTRLLVLTSLLKTLCCAAPLMKNETHGEKLAASIAENIDYLPLELKARFSGLLETCSEFGEDTHSNVDLFVRKIIDEFAVLTK